MTYDLLTNDQVAERVGLAYDTLYSYRRRKSFPEPDTYFGRTPLWKIETVDKWLESRKRSKVQVQ